MRILLASLTVAFFIAGLSAQEGLPPGIKNTQDPRDVPPSPEEAARRFQPGKGFQVTLFAGEPQVCQPIAVAFDDRGRLWVAECFSYPRWQKEGRDRIVIFEDTDGDGRFDRRKVFYDKASNLTSVLIGRGGVWALCAPKLLFFPDKDSDDVPDGEPEVVLDGWTLKAGHNIVNGLMWGPDGWLYGRHGITAESLVGRPGTPASGRTRLNCSIWRYHPTRKVFEAVAHGTTNPWGMDFDEHGEAFFTNCVIGHLWHLVPGARYQRMYGLDYNPYSYELIASTSDHLHWGGGHWTTSRGGQGIHSEAGGGHAHTGGMIYLGDNWPRAYRNSIFMCNLHGNRLNRDLLVRAGNSYVGKHAPDFIRADNPWFRAVAMDYGPDGGVFVTDWCDLGECHDNDGVHRSSGRIYKIFHGKPAHVAGLNLAKKTNAELVQLQLHPNDWYVRHARRLLTERALRARSASEGRDDAGAKGKSSGGTMVEVHQALLKIFDEKPEVPRKLRALWALYTTGGASLAWLRKQLAHGDEHVRIWAIRLLCDQHQPDSEVVKQFAGMARDDPSGLVRLYLASMLQRMDLKDRLSVALPLARHGEDADDRCQPLLIWYGIEPAVNEYKEAALDLASKCRMPKLRLFIARRLAEGAGSGPDALDPIVNFLARLDDPAVQKDILLGLRQGLRGRKSVPRPPSWNKVYPILAACSLLEVRQSAWALALQFKDAEVLAHLRQRLADASLTPVERTAVLETLVSQGVAGLAPALFKLLKDPALRRPALRALAAYPHEETPKHILRIYKNLSAEEKQDALGTLASRPTYALALLDAIDKGIVPRANVSPFTARQLQDLRDRKVAVRLEQVWGRIRQTPAAKKALIAKYKALLTPQVLAKADPSKGRLVFNRTCHQCHTLFGEGHKIGPDLSGSNRFDLHYVLENMIDPSAVIGRDYQLTNIVTGNGRLISGIVVEETERALTVQTANDRLVVPKNDIEERRLANVSMMPEGQLEQLTFNQLRDLVRYLGSKEQAALPK